MKHTIMTLMVAGAFGLVPFTAVAMDDDFGAPFTDQAPAGLEDADETTLSIENISPELIEPAAGDEAESEEQDAQSPVIEAPQTPEPEDASL